MFQKMNNKSAYQTAEAQTYARNQRTAGGSD